MYIIAIIFSVTILGFILWKNVKVDSKREEEKKESVKDSCSTELPGKPDVPATPKKPKNPATPKTVKRPKKSVKEK